MDRKLLLAALAIFAILGIRFFLFFSSQKSYQDGEKVRFEAILLKSPQISGTTQRISLTPEGRSKVTVVTPRFPEFFYGQKLLVDGTVSTKVLTDKRVISTIYFPTIEAKDSEPFFVLGDLRKNLITIFSSSFNPASESLMLGIVFGIRSTMPKDLGEALKTTGVIHITAASGMNVTMVAGAVFYLLSGFLRRQVAIVIGVLFVWLYAVLAGLEPSILRATIMSSFAFAAALLGRQNTGLLALGFTAVVLLFITPSLLTDIGFLLSCFSTLGIILFANLLGRGRERVDPLVTPEKATLFSSLASDLQTTLAAQAGTLPILFASFGQYNLLSILANLLILWTIPILMIVGAIGALIGLIFQPLAKLVLYLALPLLLYIEWVVVFFAKYPILIKLQETPIAFVIGYYCVFLSVYLIFRRKLHTG